MFSDERGQGARKEYFSDIPIKYGGQHAASKLDERKLLNVVYD